MPIQDLVNAGQAAFLNNTQSTHSKSVQASAARLLLQLRADFAAGQERDLTEREHAFLKTPALENCTPSTGIPAEWDTRYPNLRGIFAFLRVAFSHARFQLEEYQIICKNISHLAEMRKDHWSTKEYYAGDELNHLQPSMGEVINLVSDGTLNDGAFQVSSQGAAVDRQDRVYLLYRQFLTVKELCSTGISNDFLFLLNGYKGIVIVEYVDAYVHELACQFVMTELLETYSINSVELYQLILNALDLESEAYEQWLMSKKEKLEAYLTARCSGAMLDPEESKAAIAKLIGGITSLEIPSDLHSAAMSAIKYILRDYTTKDDLPLVKEAIKKVGGVLKKMKSLSYVESFGFIDFYQAIEYMHRSQKYQNRNLFVLGAEEGGIVNAAIELNTLLTPYFLIIQQQVELRSEYLHIPKEIKAANAALSSAIKQYESGSLKEFVESFFGIIWNQENQGGIKKVCEKMDAYRTLLFLTDDQLEAWLARNLNRETGEVSITVYEVNRVLLHALWVDPRDWTAAYKNALELLFEWFDNPNESDLCKQAVKNTCLKFMKFIRLLYVIVSGGRLEDVEKTPRILSPKKIYKSVNLHDNIENHLTIIDALIGDGKKNFEQHREFYLGVVRQIKKFNVDIDGFGGFLKDWPLPEEERAIVFDEMLQMESLGQGGFMGYGPITGFLKASDQAVSDDEKDKVMLFLHAHVNEIVRWSQCVDILYDEMSDGEKWISTRPSEELNNIKRKLLENTDLSVLLYARTKCDMGSPSYDLLTKKIKFMISRGAWMTEEDLCEFLSKHVEDEAEVVEILSMLYESPVHVLKFTDEMSDLLKRYSFNTLKGLYNILVRGRLSIVAPTNKNLSAVYNTFPSHTDTRKGFFEEVFKALTQSERPEWSMHQIYNLYLNGMVRHTLAGAEKLNTFLNRAKTYGYVFTLSDMLSLLGFDGDVRLLTIDFYLRQLSGDWLERMRHYLYHETKTSHDISFQAAFLNLYYKVIHERAYDRLCGEIFLALGFYFRNTFIMSDEDIFSILENHYDKTSQSLRLSESEINLFVVHALHVAPQRWTPEFKHAFGLMLQVLKTADLEGPLGIREFIDNLHGLWLVAERTGLLLDHESASLLNYQYEIKYLYGGYPNESHESIFSTSYLCTVFCLDIFDENNLGRVKRSIFDSIKPELSHHMRTFSDFRILLSMRWLTESEHDELIAMEMAKNKVYVWGSKDYLGFWVIEHFDHLTKEQHQKICSMEERSQEADVAPTLTTLSLFNQGRPVNAEVSCKNTTVVAVVKR